MKINFDSIKGLENVKYSPIIEEFNKLNYSDRIKEFKKVNIEISFEKINEILKCEFKIDFEAFVISSYTLKPFNYLKNIDDILYFTTNKEYEDEDVILCKEIIDLDNYVYSLILSSIPLNAHKSGEKLKNFDDINVYSEDEYKKNKESPFDILKDIEIDDK